MKEILYMAPKRALKKKSPLYKLIPLVISLVKWKQTKSSPFQCISMCCPRWLALTHQMWCESWKTPPPSLYFGSSSSSCFFSSMQMLHPSHSSSFPSLHDLAEVLASVSFRTTRPIEIWFKRQMHWFGMGSKCWMLTHCFLKALIYSRNKKLFNT